MDNARPEVAVLSREPGYAFDNAWEEARRRLGLLEEVVDPYTTRYLEGLGVGPGWRCLEVGGGGGSITRWLCSRVGPSGRVVAVDLDTRFLDELAEDNLEVHNRNVVTNGLPGAGYDLVHTRAVLMHIPEREQVLGSLVSALRPGGWLLLEEVDNYPILATSSGLYRKVWIQGMAALATVGMASEWARDLPELLDRAGLADVGTEAQAKSLRGGSPYARLLQLSFVQARDLVLAEGITEEEFDVFLGLLEDPARWFPGFAMVSAWGRRPSPPEVSGP